MSSLRRLEPPDRTGHLSPATLELLAFVPDGLPTASEKDGAHAAGCNACQEKIRNLRAERAAFLVRRPAHAFVTRITGSGRQTSGRWVWLAPMVLTPLLLLLVLRPTGDDVRFRGGTFRLEVMVARGDAVLPLEQASPLRAQDRIRLLLTTPSEGYLFVANLDDRGHFTRYFPTDQAESHAVSVMNSEPLPGSVLLDNFVGQELVAAVFSRRPLTEGQVREALTEALRKAGGDLARVEQSLDLSADVVISIHRKVAQ